ncbi:hypothetical protein EVAR_11417_1 [Eumeta japonica]|uniref:Uncharacterized protein n=1 Tax=Eumeta variegata TaxID=151549 RepID=A0A4C1TM21_EUMVA|nr:hypothetical protein EVAR_11417_1 [Eumeta japonica]
MQKQNGNPIETSPRPRSAATAGGARVALESRWSLERCDPNLPEQRALSPAPPTVVHVKSLNSASGCSILREGRLSASCPSSLFHTWESLLQEVEADVVALGGAADSLQRLVSAPLSERTYHLKLQARKLFVDREGCEMILAQADNQLNKIETTIGLENWSRNRVVTANLVWELIHVHDVGVPSNI